MTIHEWFDAYGESHQNPTNKLIHWICVPVIFFCVVALLSLVPLPLPISMEINLAQVVLVFASLFYIKLSWKLAISTILFALACLGLAYSISGAGYNLFVIALSAFVLAWIGQFYGHHIEGKKPSFLKDLQFLLIGPAWLLGFVYRKIGLNY
jgi:uncharacterized membrane protein YGL010W